MTSPTDRQAGARPVSGLVVLTLHLRLGWSGASAVVGQCWSKRRKFSQQGASGCRRKTKTPGRMPDLG